METNTMTDSELLENARLIAVNDDDKDYTALARFVADYLDDSPVTEEALREMGFEKISEYAEYMINEKRICVVIREGSAYMYETIYYRGRRYSLPNMSTLRHLLRGLGVTT